VFRVRLLEPFKRSILVSKPAVDHRDLVGREVPFTGYRDEIVDDALGVLTITRRGVCKPESRARNRIVIAERLSLCERRDGLRVHVFLDVGQSHTPERQVKMRVEFERLPLLLNRFIVSASNVEHPSDVLVDDERQGIDLLRPPKFRQALVELSRRDEIEAVPL